MVDSATQTAPATRPSAWSRAFPATADQVPQARRFLAGVLGDAPRIGDAVLCLSELAANAVLHSNSACAGGQFTIHATLGSGLLRVEVTNGGGLWKQRAHHNGHGGRGFIIVNALARTWGTTGDGITSRTVWFEIAVA
jgi:anti-sigma regulatory factor (Ser/Thr protein kinase)